MTKNFTEKAKEALETAKKYAEKLGHTYLGSEHILIGIVCTECVASKLLDDKKVLFSDVYDNIVSMSGLGASSELTYCAFTPKCKKILEGASILASRYDGKLIGTEHILHSICESADSVAARILISLGINLQSLRGEICSFLEMGTDASHGAKGAISASPILSLYGISLNETSGKDIRDPLIERDAELDRIIQILSRRTKNNPCLIGEPGVGKTAIVEGLASRITEGNVPESLADKEIISIDLSSMVAGAKYRGDFEERMRGVLNEAKSNPSIILFIDEIHTIVGAGSAEGAVDAANIIKPALARGQIRVIGATTVNEYRKYIEKDAALERRFQPVMIEEPTETQATNILFGLRERYEQHHGVKITDDAIKSAVYLSKRYINDRYLPDKAIDLIDEACSAKKIKYSQKSPDIASAEERIRELIKKKEKAILSEDFESASEIRDEELLSKIALNKMKAQYYSTSSDKITVNSDDICDAVSVWTHIPVSRLADKETARLMELKDRLEDRVIGQSEAISSVVSAIKRGRIGLKSPLRPTGSFLFLGPTGVGKTYLAKCIAEELFSSRNSLIRLDMSEYSEKHSISKLIGSPPGYVGYDEGGILTEAVRRMPYSVVLLDEIEKAHRDIYNVLLQILDDGVLTDSRGRTVSFKNCIIILTSNIGAEDIIERKRFGFYEKSEDEDKKSIESEINAKLRASFSPELLNRLDETVIFNRLGESECKRITELMLGRVKEIAILSGITLSFDSSVTEHLAQMGYDKIYGARPLRRIITSYIENPLSDRILAGKITDGDTVTVKYSDKIEFIPEKRKKDS